MLVASGRPHELGRETQPRAVDGGVVELELDVGVVVLVRDVVDVELGVVVDERLVVEGLDDVEVLVLVLDVVVLVGRVVVEEVLVVVVGAVDVEVDVAVPVWPGCPEGRKTMST